jgi:hypothetical protein
VATLTFTLLSGSIFAQTQQTQEQPQQQPQQNPRHKEDRSGLEGLVKFAVWHEGCRIYAADNSIGDVDDIRTCVADVYAQNQDVQKIVNGASPDALMAAVRTAGRDIPSEHHIREQIAYACKHENLLQEFVDMEQHSDYEGIRTLYFSTFRSDENVRNLLAAVSDESLSDLINENK